MNSDNMVGYAIKAQKAMLMMSRQCWEQGMLAHTLLITKQWELLRLAVHDIVLRQSSDGRLCNVENSPAITDSAFCIASVLKIGEMEDNQDYLKAVEKNIKYLIDEAPKDIDGVPYHIIGTQEVWADSAAFTPYALALTGHDEEALKIMFGILKRLHNKDTGLFYHIWSKSDKNHERRVFWGIGNGWILTGLLRLILVLNEDYVEEKSKLLNIFKSLLDAILVYKTKDNLFYDILDNDSSFLETEVSEMVAYVIYVGVLKGLICKSYIKYADEIRRATNSRILANGLVVGGASSPDFVKPGTSVETQAHYILMEFAAKKYYEIQNS